MKCCFRFDLLFLALLGLTEIFGAAIPSERDREKRAADLNIQKYLTQFGYIDEGARTGRGGAPLDDGERRAALREFQIFNHLPVTGELDDDTLKLMHTPRCGVKDVMSRGEKGGLTNDIPENFRATAWKWPKNKITWNPTIYTRQLSEASQWWEFKHAFDVWAKHSPLEFEYMNGADKPDIEIKFATGNHGDGVGNSFDGRDGVLAHAFYPGNSEIAGDTHFDDAEQWTINSKVGTNLLFAAAHEFGHALGLGHSTVKGALMAPYYQEFDPNFDLHEDDKNGIQKLYGKPINRGGPDEPKTTQRPTQRPTTPRPYTPRPTTARPVTQRPVTQRPVTPRPTTPKPDVTTQSPGNKPHYCDMKFDAVTQGPDGRTYIFRHSLVYRITRNGLDSGFPKPTREIFERAPIRIGAAAYVQEKRQTFFFKGSRIWRYTNFKLDEGYPKYVDRFPEWPHAGMTLQSYRGAKSQLYLFGRDKFWEWNYDTEKVIGGYPQPINKYWRGVPDGVEAAVTWNDGFIYFFKGKKYRKFDKYYRTATKSHVSAPAWFGGKCGSAGKLIQPPIPSMSNDL